MGQACSSDKAVKVDQPSTPKDAPKAEPAQVPEASKAEASAQKATAADSGDAEVPAKKDTEPHSSVDGQLLKALLTEDDEEFAAIVDALDDKDKQMQWWKDLDQNGNGIVSLSEIHKFVRDKGWTVEAAPLMQAYKFTTAKGDDFVQKNEFPRLLRALVYMSRLWDIFQDIDTSDDRRIELAEFTAGFAKMGYPLTEDAAKDAFTAIDKNGGGMIMFGEFCRYIAKLINPTAVDFEDGTVADAPANAEKPAETAEAAESADQQPAEAAPAAEDSNNNDDDAKDSVDEAIVKAFLEEGDEDFKAIVDNLNNKDKYDEWWKDLDQNGNGIVSLSEIQKFVRDQGWKVEAAPLMQAYKFTTAKGDDFVQKNEFPRLVHSMVFMGRLWDIFQDIDSSDDRRIELDEFSAGFAKMGCKLTDDAAKAAFGEIDRNGGGKILFGEFCRYIAKLYGSEAIATGEAVEAAADDQ